MKLKERFSKNFAVALASNGLEQKDIAKALGVSNAMISKYANAEKLPSVEKLILISKMLGVSIDALLTKDLSEKVKRC